MLINSKDNNLKSLADLKGKKLALIEGHYVIEKIKTRFPEIDIVMTSGVSDSVSRLINHEVDAVFGVNSVLSSAKTTSLSKGLELITQNDIKPLPLHFFTEPSKPILHSILNKALTYISQTKKDNIIQHWLGEDELKKTVSIAFGIGSAPYSLTQEPWRGIEYDLIKKIFGVSQIKIESAEDMSKELLPQQLHTQSQFDVISSVAIQQPQYYYSDKFVTMSNVVVTKKADHFKINSLVDLIDKSVYAFSGALNELGPEYFNVFNPESYKGSYQEYRVQKNQVSDFLLGDVDAMIIDRKIFYWYARINGYSSFENFEFHELFPKEKEFYVGFKQLKLRDIFNKNLAAIKKTGEYQYILDEYNNGTVVPKIKLTSLISAILAPFIFKNNHQAIISLTKKLNSLPYINKIEVYNKHDKLIHATSTQEYRYYKHADSYSFVSKIWTKVGSIKVYFEQNLVVENLGGDDLIPDISFYDDQKEKSHITEVYKNFSYFSNKVNFSTEEKRYIATHPVLKFSEVSWQPLSIVAESGNIGLIFDYLQIFSQKTGIQFELVPADNWPQAVEKFKANEIDFLPGITKLKKYTDIGKISDEYAYFNFSIIMNSDASFADSISDIKGKKIALVNDTSAYHYIKTYYPDAYTVEAHNVTEVLKMIQQGEADVAIGHLAASVYQLENKFSDLKIVGILDSGYSHRVLVQPNNELLLSIFNKVINDIPIEQHRDIRERWMNQKILTAVDYRLVYQIVTGFLLLLFLILLVVKKLTNAKKYVDKTNLEFQRTIADLKTTQQHLVESEKMASLGGLVAGVAHEINTPVGIGLTAITHFLSINDELKLKHQQQKISQKYFEKYLKDSTESANIINRNLERTAQLVSSFKRISVDQSSDECRTFPVKKYIDEILLSVNHVIKRSKIDIHISCSDSLKINSHPGAMAQILTNLIINSSIHGFPNNAKGNIFIDITTDQQHVTLTYHDDGCGISGKNLNKIFDPFFTTNREHGGSGLGLNIVYNIVHTRLGGTIMCTSELNEGVKFVIKFDVDIVSQ
ncbi:MAG: transporter substrate-binding domain-containing protein [Gammaproteobacteria bacterium]|nr:transporter substrate-binding domain-containing protein [Gammaproteobacteria bacterium]